MVVAAAAAVVTVAAAAEVEAALDLLSSMDEVLAPAAAAAVVEALVARVLELALPPLPVAAAGAAPLECVDQYWTRLSSTCLTLR